MLNVAKGKIRRRVGTTSQDFLPETTNMGGGIFDDRKVTELCVARYPPGYEWRLNLTGTLHRSDCSQHWPGVIEPVSSAGNNP